MRPDACTPDCEACPTVAAAVRLSGIEVRCDCGAIYTPRWDGSEAEEAPDPGRLTLRARAEWPALLVDLHLARRYRAAQAGPSAGAPRAPSCPIGCLQGAAGGAQRDASGSQVASLWEVIQRPGAHRIRSGFVETLERWLEETTPRAETDWGRARRAAERLTRLDGPNARLLAMLGGELAAGASWRSAAALTAETAPDALRAAWGARMAEERGLVGRPRREVGAPPVDAERIAWGEARLTGAVLAWAEGR